jgi:hypothetical protein
MIKRPDDNLKLSTKNKADIKDIDLEKHKVAELPEREAISLVNPGTGLPLGVSAAAGLLPDVK